MAASAGGPAAKALAGTGAPSPAIPAPPDAAEGVPGPNVTALLPPPAGPTPPLARGQGDGEAEGTDEEPFVYNSGAPTPSYLPPPDEVDSINADGGKVSAIFAFCGIDAEVGVAVLTALGIETDDHYSTLGSIHPGELEDMMKDVKANGVPIKLGVKTKIRNTLRVGRTLAGMKELPPPSFASPGVSLSSQPFQPIIQVTLPPQPVAPEPAVAPEVVLLNQTVDQTSDIKIKNLDPAKLKELRGRFKKARGDPPKEDENVTREQLSALFMLSM